MAKRKSLIVNNFVKQLKRNDLRHSKNIINECPKDQKIEDKENNKMATTLPKGALAPQQTEQTSTKSAVSLIDSLLSTPTLPQGTTITPQAQNVQQAELLATPGVTGTLSATAAQATAPTAAMGTAATTQQVAGVTPQATGQFTADVVGTAPTMTAAQGTVTAPMTAAQQSLANIDSRATVQGQLENISQDIETSLLKAHHYLHLLEGLLKLQKQPCKLED